jgi:hypothetical protein
MAAVEDAQQTNASDRLLELVSHGALLRTYRTANHFDLRASVAYRPVLGPVPDCDDRVFEADFP